MTRLLFVCLGNICRSPTAEAVMTRLVADAGRSGAFEIESAGTGAWHVGKPPDGRATSAAQRRGFTMQSVARQVTPEDFARFDLLLAMDRDNLDELHRLAPDAAAMRRARLLREFDPASADQPDLAVPDPYYGGADGFDHVLDLVEAACAGLLADLRGIPA